MSSGDRHGGSTVQAPPIETHPPKGGQKILPIVSLNFLPPSSTSCNARASAMYVRHPAGSLLPTRCRLPRRQATVLFEKRHCDSERQRELKEAATEHGQ